MIKADRILEVLRFAAVGIAGTLMYAIVAFAGVGLGAKAFPAHVIASASSLVFSYAGQKIFTFRIKGGHRRLGPRFVIATLIVVALQTLIVWTLSRIGVSADLTLLAGIVFYPPASYIIHTFWTFRNEASARSQ